MLVAGGAGRALLIGRASIRSILMTLASGVRFGGYEIVASIGAGGMGEVYRSR